MGTSYQNKHTPAWRQALECLKVGIHAFDLSLPFLYDGYADFRSLELPNAIKGDFYEGENDLACLDRGEKPILAAY
jgi:hypothetical protein